jgi:hypothetical protein
MRGGPSPLEPTSASATNAGREAAATTKDMATAAAAGMRGGPSPLEPTSASAADAGREAAVAGLVAKTTDTATAAATTNEAAADGCDGPAPKKAAVAAGTSVLAEASTRTTEVNWRPVGEKNAALVAVRKCRLFL